MNTKINKFGYCSIIFFTCQSMFLGVGISQILNSSETGSIFSVIIGSIFSLLLLLLITKFSEYEKDLTLFEKLEKLFGKYIGKIINFCLFLIFTLFFIYCLWSVNTYIQNKYLDITPSILIISTFLIPVIWCVSCGIKTISKVSLIIFFICLFEILFSSSNLISSIEIDNLKPFFNTPFLVILKNAFVYAAYFVTPTFMMITIPNNQIDDNKNLNKTMVKFYLFCSFNFLLLFIFIIGIFGIELSKLFYYPEFTLMKKINYFDFIQHIENILSAQWIYSLFITTVMSLNFIKDYLNHIKMNKKITFFSIILFSLISSLLIFKNTTIGYNFIKNYFIKIYTIPLIILGLISIFLIYKNKKN